MFKISKEYYTIHDVSASFIQIYTLKKAKELPCIFNNCSFFYKEKLETVNLLDITHLKKY
ncbi:YoaP domain-containing protein [Clostridioides difficile]|nr:YoaP domain-containing protein [Clostridioides difficile]